MSTYNHFINAPKHSLPSYRIKSPYRTDSPYRITPSYRIDSVPMVLLPFHEAVRATASIPHAAVPFFVFNGYTHFRRIHFPHIHYGKLTAINRENSAAQPFNGQLMGINGEKEKH